MELESSKKTEIGIIPKDWEVRELGEVCFPSNVRINPLISNKNFKCIELEHISQGTGILLGYAHSKDLLSQKSIFEKGDVLFGKLRPYLRKFLFADFDGVCTTEIWVLKAERNVSKIFLYYLIQSEKVIEAANVSTGTKMPRAVWKTVSETKIAVPPESEQIAIAASLHDADIFIKNLENLLQKKRSIKQGAVQKLLQPKGGWEVQKLGDVAQINTGKKNNQDKVENGQYPFFVRSQSIERINSYSFDGEAILIPGEGNIGKIFHYINGKFDFHQRVYKISHFKEGFSGKYIYRYISEYFGKHALQNSVKATVDSLRLPTFQVFQIPFPSTFNEQNQIAKILSDMDEEITALERKLEKYRMIKLGMMQNLLTGKIRLV